MGRAERTGWAGIEEGRRVMRAAERLQDAIGEVRDEYVLEAHEEDATTTSETPASGAKGEPNASAAPAPAGREAPERPDDAPGDGHDDAERDDESELADDADADDKDDDETTRLAVVPGGRSRTSRRTSASGTNFVSILVLLGVAASIACVFLGMRDQIVEWMNGQVSMYSTVAGYSVKSSGDAMSGGGSGSSSHSTSGSGSSGGSGWSWPTFDWGGSGSGDAATDSDAESVPSATGGAGKSHENGTPSYTIDDGDAFVLTAAEWNDNLNWPFFTNLVNAGVIEFPAYGLDPTHRVRVALTGAGGVAARGETVTLLDADGNELWRARSDKDGVAYLFYQSDQTPATVVAGGVTYGVSTMGGGQGSSARATNDVKIRLSSRGATPSSLQVMFIVDTTGSMADELAYLQKDFSSIAAEVGSSDVTWSANFYRDEGDEYVTRLNGFTSNVATVQAQIAAEYADGGGDAPEAVAQVLEECVTNNGAWRDDAAKVAFLVFDAPPHAGTEATLAEAVRSAAARGIRLVPVVASNAERPTELFGRALAILTNGTYVYLTDDSGVGDAHLEPIVGEHKIELLHDVIVRVIQESR